MRPLATGEPSARADRPNARPEKNAPAEEIREVEMDPPRADLDRYPGAPVQNPAKVDSPPRSVRRNVPMAAGRSAPAIGAVLLGAAGAGIVSGIVLEPSLEIAAPTANDAAAGAEVAAGRRFLDRARDIELMNRSGQPTELAGERRALYLAFTQGGSTSIGHTRTGPTAIDPTPIDRGGGRTEYPPLKESNGKRVYFLYGFQPKGSMLEQLRTTLHRASIDDDIEAARAKGYTVIVDRDATEADVRSAAYDPHAAGIVWASHGTKGGFVQTSGGKFLKPIDLERARISKNLRFVVLQACHSDEDPDWQKLFSSAKVITFEGKTKWGTILDFNRANTAIGDALSGQPLELDDLIRDKL